MKIGIATEETWDFLHEIYTDLCQHHDVNVFVKRASNWPIFNERHSRSLFNHDMREFLRQNDIVFFEWASNLLVAATKLPKTCKIVTRLHRYEMYQWVDKVNWKNVDQIILVSQAKEDEFLDRFPDQVGKTTAINPGVNLERFPFYPKQYCWNIGILCHLTPRKRVYELILDFYELTKHNSNFHLHIGGDPHPSHMDYYAAINYLVKKLNLDNLVTFYGPVHDTTEWFRKIDIFISNSYSEGLQVALLEAMSTGCYCISHYWAGVDELLPKENLYYTGSQLQDLILTYSLKSEAEQLKIKQRMNNIVSAQCDSVSINNKIRTIIEEFN